MSSSVYHLLWLNKTDSNMSALLHCPGPCGNQVSHMNSLAEIHEVSSPTGAYRHLLLHPVLSTLFCPEPFVVFSLGTPTVSCSFSLVSRSLMSRLFLSFWAYFLLWIYLLLFYPYLTSLTLDLARVWSQHLCVLWLLLNYQVMPTTWLWFLVTECTLVLNRSLASQLSAQLTCWFCNPAVDLDHINISAY